MFFESTPFLNGKNDALELRARKSPYEPGSQADTDYNAGYDVGLSTI